MRSGSKFNTKPWVLLLGNPGAGKSTIGNALVGSNAFPTGPGMRGVTTAVFSAETSSGHRVVDTPGMLEAEDSATQRNLQVLQTALTDLDDTPGVIVFVIRSLNGRVRTEDVAMWESISRTVVIDADSVVLAVNAWEDDEASGHEFLQAFCRRTKLQPGMTVVCDEVSRSERRAFAPRLAQPVMRAVVRVRPSTLTVSGRLAAEEAVLQDSLRREDAQQQAKKLEQQRELEKHARQLQAQRDREKQEAAARREEERRAHEAELFRLRRAERDLAEGLEALAIALMQYRPVHQVRW